ncbi:hypothetical protein RF55_10533 [Lasius niger]|uniref:Uncharacterized protein n=1 Tax=Lasius niger TaxID=67767 RepID=A0A0J7KH69_LASNI|nr:hypothetical protein RF55_10533 [Lasius niger]
MKTLRVDECCMTHEIRDMEVEGDLVHGRLAPTGPIKLSDSEAGVEARREHRQAERSFPSSGQLHDPVNLIGGGVCGQRDLGQPVCRFGGAAQHER